MRKNFLTLPLVAKLFARNQKKTAAQPTLQCNQFDDSLVDLLIEDMNASPKIVGYIEDAKELIPESVRKEHDTHIVVALMGLAGHLGLYDLNPPKEVGKAELERFVSWAMENRPASAISRSEKDTKKLLAQLLQEYFHVTVQIEEFVLS